MLEKPVLRVKELSLRRFRGFVNCEPIRLDTNADVILLTGPNGFGKTSAVPSPDRSLLPRKASAHVLHQAA